MTMRGLSLLIAAHDRPALRLVERERFEVKESAPEPPEEPAPDALGAAELPQIDVRALSGDDPEWLGASASLPEVAAPVVRLAAGRGAPIPLISTYAEVVVACLDGIALAARHRALLPREGRSREEERILAFVDALVVTPRFPTLLVAWWEDAADLPDPWKIWAPTFALGCLDGEDLPEALAAIWRRIPDDDAGPAAIAGEALALGANPARLGWARQLMEDAHPGVRAAALEATSLSDAVDPDRLIHVLASDPERGPRWAAARAAARLPRDTGARATSADGRLDELLVAELHRAPDGELAWQAARALALRGIPAAYEMLRRDESLLALLGARALDVLALLGGADDASLARRIVARSGLTSDALRGLGRFGHPGAAPVLVRALGDEDAAEEAEAALSWIFGTPFDEEERLASPEAWRGWFASAPLDEAVRYRFGEPYRPGWAATLAAGGTRSQADLAWLVDEGNVRAAIGERPALFRWSPEADAALDATLAVMSREDPSFIADSWRSSTRSEVRTAGASALHAARSR